MSAIHPADVDGISEPAKVIPQTQVGDYTEWSGWLASVIDLLVANDDTDPRVRAGLRRGRDLAELAEHRGRRDAGALRTAQATSERLGAQPWLARARGEAVTRGRPNAR